MGRPHYDSKTVRDRGTLTNVDTGEVIEAVFEHNVPEAIGQKRFRRSRRVGMTFAMVDQQSIRDLELVPSEQRLIGALLTVADKNDESRSRISTSLLATRLEMHPSNVSKILRALQDRKIIFKEGPGYWRVTPWYAWVGEWTEWDRMAKNYPEPTWKR
jgi:hypothetical protein